MNAIIKKIDCTYKEKNCDVVIITVIITITILGMQAEKEYQQKLKNCLDNPEYERMHPLRRAMQQRSLQNA